MMMMKLTRDKQQQQQQERVSAASSLYVTTRTNVMAGQNLSTAALSNVQTCPLFVASCCGRSPYRSQRVAMAAVT